MKFNNVQLIGYEGFDGIVEKILIENDVKMITIVLKQWYSDTYALSALKFTGVIFQSLPDISSFNLINEITTGNDPESVLSQLNEYMSDNPTLNIPNTRDNIKNEVEKAPQSSSFFFRSGYSRDWLIICEQLSIEEEIKT